ncbi:stage II sporulation protein M [Methanohalophilus profundi]|uniref:stage II sporulation protein M n=1 Tax=Methanohalophilus profundi TaxID=2138083 RepID=UPI0013ED45CB|nr:stage II sporulation protein M [Methanohalophilus profundi]
MSSKPNFLIKWPAFLWCLKIFTYSAILTALLALASYAIMTMLAEPVTINETIDRAASAATSKVQRGAVYVGITWSVFLFNSLAALTASAGTALFVYLNRYLLKDITSRRQHHNYAKISIAMERGLYPIYRVLEWPAERFFGFRSINTQTAENSVWNYTGYSRYHFQLLTAIVPFSVPLLVAAANGAILGMLFAFHLFNGAFSGYHLAGINGIVGGVVYNVTFFISAILPHGIIEIPVILVSTSIGYVIADSNCRLVRDKHLFVSDNIADLEADIATEERNTGTILFSPLFWKIYLLFVLLLLITAFIETEVTPDIITRALSIVEPFVSSLLNS